MHAEPGTADAPDAPRRILVVLALWGGVFFALLVAGLGMTSLLLEADVIAVDGVGQAPGVVGVCAALAAWAGVTYPALRRRAGVGAAVLAGAAAGVAYVGGVVVTAIVTGTDPALAVSIAGRLVTDGFAVVVAVAGVLAAVGAVVAVRMRPGAARWPWEHDD